MDPKRDTITKLADTSFDFQDCGAVAIRQTGIHYIWYITLYIKPSTITGIIEAKYSFDVLLPDCLTNVKLSLYEERVAHLHSWQFIHFSLKNNKHSKSAITTWSTEDQSFISALAENSI